MSLEKIGKNAEKIKNRALRLLKGNGKLSPNITWKCSCLIGKIL